MDVTLVRKSKSLIAIDGCVSRSLLRRLQKYESNEISKINFVIRVSYNKYVI